MKIESKSLMLGDWVKSRTGMNVRIVGIDHDYPSEYEPIPLTAEILEKNGFIYDGHIIGSDGYDCKSYNINDSQVWGYLTKEGFDIAFGGHNQPSGIILPYVHTLQNALRLCGLEELADNFKIG